MRRFPTLDLDAVVGYILRTSEMTSQGAGGEFLCKQGLVQINFAQCSAPVGALVVVFSFLCHEGEKFVKMGLFFVFIRTNG